MNFYFPSTRLNKKKRKTTLVYFLGEMERFVSANEKIVVHYSKVEADDFRVVSCCLFVLFHSFEGGV